MSDDQRVQGELRVVAKLAGRSLDDTYRLFRLPGAPAPVAHVACVPVYDVEEAIAWLQPGSSDDGLPSRPAWVARIDAPGESGGSAAPV